ncbi:MAG: ABC transporter substrate-binding protein [Actinobacteria bacterium]|nr:MAG: ABC transporter substrate-binding protein [Actinomycetota bacterium]
MVRLKRSAMLWAMAVVVAVLATGCGGSSKSKGGTTTPTAAGGKGGTLITLANAAPAGSPDPQVNYTLQEWQWLILTHDGLVGYKRVSGPEGTKKVPDLATAIPKPTDNGKTWTFTLRSGIKFSNGNTVTANDVKATFERLFKIGNSPNAGSWYNVIVGGDACVKTPKTCDLSKGIVVNGDTITFHLTKGDPEFLDKLSVPFAYILPADTPAKNLNLPPAGTGPYKWVQYSPQKQMKIVRNPYFKEWSKDAQPDGLPDSIVQKFGLSVEAEVTQVENGQADWIANADSIPSDRLPELSSKYATQVHITPLTAVYYFAFNVRVPPFNNLKARQAVNYATDRNALVKLYGGTNVAVPTCQILPPNFPGYKPYCPYTVNPGSGKWTGPDMAKAKQLVQQSGTKGASVKVNSDTTEVDKAYGLYFIGLLNKLGYKASPQFLSNDIQYPFIQNSKNKVQFAYSSWFQDYPAASDFLDILLGCGSFHPNSNSSPNIAEFCNKPIQAKMDQAGAMGLTDPVGANNLWAQVDKEVTDQAPWVSMFNPKLLDFTSSRVKGFQFSPQWYFLLAQASVK